MATKKRNFYAYQIDLHYLSGKKQQTDAIKWDPKVIKELLSHIISLPIADRTKHYHDSWLVYLDHYSEERLYYFGRFGSAEYGTNGELIHADNYTLRPNPKNIREGETQYTYFAIRKSDGLMLLQGNLKVNRSLVEEYFENLGKSVIHKNALTYIQICTLINSSFFNDVNSLDTVNKIQVEVTTTVPGADENEAVKEMQKEADKTNATTVKLEFTAKFRRSGLVSAVPFLKNYKDKPGVEKIVVRGKLAGAEKIIRMEDSQEKFKQTIEVDKNNQPKMKSVEIVLSGIMDVRKSLR
ncbi:hypothetical protein [Paenibacillus sp. MDMC362]|uniref:hypothetical protein n=1 Tax=Paenibacillus sp. MDMC362 TaxID=2977365 RepID=UPI000DC460DE|nr:hypothetical protein [Paenibacillus sp. MDMC362]RAR39652.1 hypothetical protein DP091_29645 [Paenibacillus sp. MDMC362]